MTFQIRRAGRDDVEAIASAHLDSIHSIGLSFYPAAIVDDWSAGLDADRYASAMERGEVFFIAVGELDDRSTVLGFSSHRILDGEHRTAVYVRGQAARRGVGSALFKAAEADAIAAGAASIHVDASLAASEFYRAHGFEEVGRGDHRLSSGRPIACVFMRKQLAATAPLWQIEASVEAKSEPAVAFRYWTRVENMTADPGIERIETDGPYRRGMRGTTHLTGGGTTEWIVADVDPGRRLVIDMTLRDATLRVELRFEPRAGGGSVLTQRMTLLGPNAAEYVEQVKAGFESSLGDGMRAVRDRIDAYVESQHH